MRTKAIHKYPIEITDEQVVVATAGWQPLSVQMQRNTPCIWALVDPDAAPVQQKVYVNGTGHPVEHNAPFLGTIQIGPLVFHVFAFSS